MSAKTKEQTQLEQDAASWRALEPHLPAILKRGIASLLEKPLTTTEQAEVKSPPIAEIIDWRNMPNADLLHHISEPAQDEKLRRSFEAIEAFREYALIPCPTDLATLADVGTAYAGGWLRNRAPEYRKRLEKALSAHKTSLSLAAHYNHQEIRMHNDGKNRPLRDFLKWDEALGAYEWPR